MKLGKINFLDFNRASELSKNEQKLIFGGTSGSYCCYWESPYDNGCRGNSTEAYHMGTKHWECNTAYAREKCGC